MEKDFNRWNEKKMTYLDAEIFERIKKAAKDML